MGRSGDPRRAAEDQRPGQQAPRTDPKQRRTRLVAIAVIVLLIFGVALTAISSSIGTGNDPDDVPDGSALPTSGPLAVTVPGDLDGDDKVTEEEQAEIKQTADTADTVTHTLGPKAVKVASSIAVTPPGKDWWDFIAAQSSYARLWEMPMPEGANWYALTWTRRFGKDINTLSMYPAVHLSFPSAADATLWASTVGSNERGLALDFLFRDNIVTVAPAGTWLAKEPFPKRLSKIEDVAQQSGYWSIDFAQQIALTTPDALFKGPYNVYWEKMGLTTTKWAAVSRDPGRWVGHVSGFDAKDVDVEAALAAINRTMNVQTGDMNAAIIATQMYARSGDFSFGEDFLNPKTAPEDADLVFSISTAMQSLMVSDSSFESDVIGGFGYWIVGDVMTVVPLAPQQTLASEENPQGYPTPTPGPDGSTEFPTGPPSADPNPPLDEDGNVIDPDKIKTLPPTPKDYTPAP